MAIYISHQSALEFWRIFDYKQYSDLRVSRIKNIANAEATASALSSAKPFGSLTTFRKPDALSLGLSSPLHILVSQPSQNRQRDNIATHLLSSQVPSGSFVEIGKDLFVASPELCFVQMTGSLGIIDAVAFGYELCGFYRKSAASEEGMEKLDPVTTSDEIMQYIEALKAPIGKHKAFQAAQHILDRSRSPAETQLAMSLTLPPQLDGYGLPKPNINLELKVPQSIQEYTFRETIECDMVWEDRRVEIEYDGRHHDADRQRAKDNDRRLVLQLMGYTHMGMGAYQMRNMSDFERFVRALRAYLGLRPIEYTQLQKVRRHNLRMHLYDHKPKHASTLDI